MENRDEKTLAILAVYKQLPPAQRQQMDQLVKAIDDGLMRRKQKTKGFGKQSALELIGKIGLLLVTLEPAPATTAPLAIRPAPRRRGRHV